MSIIGCNAQVHVLDPDSCRKRTKGARLDSMGDLVGTTSTMGGFGKMLADRARAHTPVGAKAEKAFVDAIKADIRQKPLAVDEESYSYAGVKKVLTKAHRARVPRA